MDRTLKTLAVFTFLVAAAASPARAEQGGPGDLPPEWELISESRAPVGEDPAPATRGRAVGDPANLRLLSGVHGGIGLLHQPVAQVGTRGTVRLALFGQALAAHDFLAAGDAQTRLGLTLAGGWTPLDWMEVYGAVGFASAYNSQGAPPLLQTLGDTTLGAKAATEVARGISVGLDLRLRATPAVGEVGTGALGVAPQVLLTLAPDPRTEAPLRLHLGAGLALDDLTGGTPADLTPVETFALGVDRHPRLTAAASLEVPLPWATPFVGWRMSAPLGEVDLGASRQDGEAPLAYGDVVSHVLTLGVSVTAVRGVALQTGLDLGAHGTPVAGLPATAPWTAWAGLAYTFDPGPVPERVTRVVRTAPRQGRLAGVVRGEDGRPVAGALLTVGDETAPVATDARGRFTTRGLSPGPAVLHVRHEGHASAAVEARVQAGETTPVEVALTRRVRPGQLLLSVVSGEARTPQAARVRLDGPTELTRTSDAQGRLAVSLPAGAYRLEVEADGFLARQRDLEVEEDAKLAAEVVLAPEPTQRQVVLHEDQLELKEQVHFLTSQAELLPDSFHILDQVIDLITRHHIERLRVEGHTDSYGSDTFNRALSQARAEAVRAYLVERGIASERIEAVGLGSARPVAPNFTDRGRAMNRRVEFHVVGD